jgi:hypothetical protein
MKLSLSVFALLAFAACGVAQVKMFRWKDPGGEKPTLTYDDKTVLEYVRPTFDPKANPPKKDALSNPTIKIYHHLYDESGTVRLTNGPEGRFPHHRGIYFGFNRISYDGQQADVWHCRNGESQRHVEIMEYSTVDARAGWHKIKATWNGRDGKTFAVEVRELTVRAAKGGRQIDFHSTLTTDRDKVRLDGDPQHAGFHFRANAEVEKSDGETYFMSPKGKGEKGKEANWAAKSGGPTNRPWTAMSFVIGDKRYTVVYLDHPDNPKEARQSERTYGRVGTYFEYDLTKDKPLKVKYRLWVQEGEVSAEQCEAMSKEFVGAK